MNVDVEGFGVAVDGDVGRGVGSGGGVEDLPTYPVHTDHGGAGLGGGVVGVGGAGDGDPVRGAGGAHHTPQGGGAPCDGEGLGRCVGRVRTGRVLNTTEVPLHPHTDAVVSVGELQAGSIVVVEGENPAGDSSEILQTAVSSWAGKQSVRP